MVFYHAYLLIQLNIAEALLENITLPNYKTYGQPVTISPT